MNSSSKYNTELIVALDTPTSKDAMEIVSRLDGVVDFYKVGLGLLSTRNGIALVEHLIHKEHRVFVDYKMFDIPSVIFRAVLNLDSIGVTYLTVLNKGLIVSAATSAANNIKILAVNELTSTPETAMNSIHSHESLDGAIAPASDAKVIRKFVDDDFIIVTPGVRREVDDYCDHRRVSSVEDAVRAGVNQIVVGRPIINSNNPTKTAIEYNTELSKYV